MVFTSSRVIFAIFGLLRSAYETAAAEMPASFAMSLIVTAALAPSGMVNEFTSSCLEGKNVLTDQRPLAFRITSVG
jgi:hypothetical protein